MISLTKLNNKIDDRIYAITFDEAVTDFKSRAVIDYLLNNDLKVDAVMVSVFDELLYDCNVKKCDVCNSLMISGYCIEGGFEYRCSDECLCSSEGNLETDIPKNEFDELFDNGYGDSYYTDWECSDDIYNKINMIAAKYPELEYKVDKAFCSNSSHKLN